MVLRAEPVSVGYRAAFATSANKAAALGLVTVLRIRMSGGSRLLLLTIFGIRPVPAHRPIASECRCCFHGGLRIARSTSYLEPPPAIACRINPTITMTMPTPPPTIWPMIEPMSIPPVAAPAAAGMSAPRS